MRIDYSAAGIDSLEVALEHLARKTDRDLRVAILLGFHGVASLLKAAAVDYDIAVTRDSRSIYFPQLVGALKSKGWLSKEQSAPLHVLATLRNTLEHGEVDYERVEFEAALYGVLPVVERIVREYGDSDLQDKLSSKAWGILLDIRSFFDYRTDVLDEVVRGVLERESAWQGHERHVYCDSCGEPGLPWRGGGPEAARCRLCGETSILAECNWCFRAVAVSEGDVWPYYHPECWEKEMG